MDPYNYQNLVGRKVLIVDDETDNLDLLQEALEEDHLNTTVATNGEKALEIAFKTPPDLILLDIIMPKMDGFETCRQLKSKPSTRDIPVIFFTTKTEHEDIDKGYSLGCVDYITKPFYLNEVSNRVRTHLLLSQSRFWENNILMDDSTDIAGMKVLIVDDAPMNIDLLQQIMEEENLNLSTAIDGETALESAFRLLPDLILLDIMMPGTDGFEVCRVLKSSPQTKNIPVIFVSAKQTPKDIEHGFSLGCVDYIPKPFRANEILSRICTQLKLKKLLMQKENWIHKLENMNVELDIKVKERTVDLQQAVELAEQVNQSKSDFISGMNHELRTPLNAILGFSQLLSLNPDEPLTDNQKTNLNEIQKAGKHLLLLIDEILDLASLESGKININMKTVDVAELLEEKVIPLLAPFAKDNNISVINQTGGQSNTLVRSDPLRLAQILINLGTNAIKYNRKGGSITVDLQTPEDDMVCIRVTNTGPGIPKDKLKSVFKPFTRLKTSGSIQGTGIGLTISKRFVELMEGVIFVESEEGEGTCFTVKLPAAEKQSG